jgi:hypothetical protein
VRAVADSAQPLPKFRLSVREQGSWRLKEGSLEATGYLEWVVPGNAQVRVEWTRLAKPPSLNGVHRNGRKRSAAKPSRS